MLIDMHAHSALSRCCKISGKNNMIATKQNGMDGFILTNHYDKSYLINGDKLEYAKRYIDEYYNVKSCGKELGFKVFFGIEVTMSKHNNAHILIYGVEPNWLLKYPDLYDYEIKDLFQLVHKYDGIIIQAHPFRKNINALLDINFLDGIELNSHTINEGPHTKKILSLAQANNLLVTSGGDFHNDAPRAKCGIYLPFEIEDIKDLVKYLKTNNKIKMLFQETKESSSIKEVIYKKQN